MKIRIGKISKTRDLIVEVKEKKVFSFRGHTFAVAVRMRFPSQGSRDTLTIYSNPPQFQVYHYSSGIPIASPSNKLYTVSKTISGAFDKFMEIAESVSQDDFDRGMSSIVLEEINKPTNKTNKSHGKRTRH